MLTQRRPFVPYDSTEEMSTSQQMKSAPKTVRRVRQHDASNFDDYLVVGLVAVVILTLFAALILL